MFIIAFMYCMHSQIITELVSLIGLCITCISKTSLDFLLQVCMYYMCYQNSFRYFFKYVLCITCISNIISELIQMIALTYYMHFQYHVRIKSCYCFNVLHAFPKSGQNSFQKQFLCITCISQTMSEINSIIVFMY